MRRKEKEITNRPEIDDILKRAQVCRLALTKENEPYLVPVFYGYDGRRLYFHTAQEGRKLDFIAANNRVCFEVELDVNLAPDSSEACRWSVSFESVIGYGAVVEMLTPEEKECGLNQIMLHYSGQKWRYNLEVLKRTKVWCIEIESITGKRSKPPSI